MYVLVFFFPFCLRITLGAGPVVCLILLLLLLLELLFILLVLVVLLLLLLLELLFTLMLMLMLVFVGVVGNVVAVVAGVGIAVHTVDVGDGVVAVVIVMSPSSVQGIVSVPVPTQHLGVGSC